MPLSSHTCKKKKNHNENSHVAEIVWTRPHALAFRLVPSPSQAFERGLLGRDFSLNHVTWRDRGSSRLCMWRICQAIPKKRCTGSNLRPRESNPVLPVKCKHPCRGAPMLSRSTAHWLPVDDEDALFPEDSVAAIA